MKMFEEHIKETSNYIDGQQMFEMLGVVANAVATLQQVVNRVVDIQDKQNEAILSLSEDVQCVAENLKKLNEKN